MTRWWIKQTKFGWWVAINPDEAIGLMDSHTRYRAFTRERLEAKLRRLSAPKAPAWEEVSVETSE